MRISRLAWTFFILTVLAVSAPAYADQNQSSSNLSLTLMGGTLSVGDQFYSQHGGSFMGGVIQNLPVDPSQATLEFGLRAHVSGVNVEGDASFNLAINNPDGSVTKVEGDAPINDMIPVAFFPNGCTPGLDCQSAVPAFFVGIASITVHTCSAQHQDSSPHSSFALPYDGQDDEGNNCSSSSQFSLPMEFESAYLSPFGGPIFMGSIDGLGNPDGQISLVSTYSQANIVWKGIQLGGFVVSGSLDNQPVSGSFAMTVNAHEDLLAGIESEEGSISLVGMSPSSLNADGHFEGHSIIPPGADCGAPFPCQVTALNSQGAFSMNGSGRHIDGSYSIMWNAPAFSFVGQALATVGGGEGEGGD